MRLDRHVRWAAWQLACNARYVKGDRRFLVVRSPQRTPDFYDVFLNWLTLFRPEVRALMELHVTPGWARDLDRYALHVPWLQDPVQQWSPATFRRAQRLAARCEEHGVPIINPVSHLANAGKATGARLIAEAGLRTPRMESILDPGHFRATLLGMPTPLFIREDWGHGGPMLRADSPDEARALPIEDFVRPVAVELIDVRTQSDGLFRKFRYTVAGDGGTAMTMLTSTDWCTRVTNDLTLDTDSLLEEEAEYINRPQPLHERFVAACQAMGLDFVAFDFGFDQNGQAVIWEANPYPFLRVDPTRRRNRTAATLRLFESMTQMYLQRAAQRLAT